ncbi:MAG: diguanylate cyclase [Betaproteobacteria bacterium]|nr:diguanylate cyclase [Betaproteobacteria bacterium]
MSIVVYERDEESLLTLKAILEEIGHLDNYMSSRVSQISQMMGLESQPILSEVKSGIAVEVTLLIINVDGGEDALDFLKSAKSDIRYKDIPVVVTSALGFNQNVMTAYAFGAVDFIRKPFSTDEAKARIHAALRLNHEIDRRKARENEITEIANQLRDLTQVLRKLSLIDPLTEVANRRAFEQTAEQEFKRAKRNKKALSVLLFDVDHFKMYNDHYGHQAGDLCLHRLAQQVQATIKRPGDMLARYGGEEFAIILPETDIQGASIIAERIIKCVQQLGIRHEYNSAAPVVTVSVGVATYDTYDAECTPEKLIEMADKAMYEAKKQGRNRMSSMQSDLISPFYIDAR